MPEISGWDNVKLLDDDKVTTPILAHAKALLCLLELEQMDLLISETPVHKEGCIGMLLRGMRLKIDHPTDELVMHHIFHYLMGKRKRVTKNIENLIDITHTQILPRLNDFLFPDRGWTPDKDTKENDQL